MNTIVQELTEAIENGYGYLGVIGRIQKEYDLDYDIAYRLHHLMLEHEYGTDSSYEDFTKKARIVLGTIGEEVGNYWLHEGEPIFQHKQVIFANNSNLSDQDQEASLKETYPGVEWVQLEHEIYDVELQFWVPKHLVGELDGKLRELIVEVHQFVTNERDIEIVIDGYFDFICETANYICIMLDNSLADLLYD